MKKNCEVRTRYASSLAEVYQQVEEISDGIKKDSQDRPLFWFRGQEKSSFILLPNIFRQSERCYNKKCTYGNNHLREEYRFQNFMARNFDNLNYRMPQSKIEWQEVMQHYYTKTRLMDWSESLTVALEFALENFIKPIKDLEVQERCCKADPIIWILRPDELNKKVYASFINGSEEIIYKALKLYGGNRKLAIKIQQELCDEYESGIYFNLGRREEKNLNAMVSLSSLELLRGAYKGNELEALRNFEINPFFFLLLRYYSDGLPIESGCIPPLAIIHPYHSERIRVQKGVFTIFPHYFPTEQMKKMEKDMDISSAITMEHMSQCISSLYKIHILDPHRVAADLVQTGAKRSNLYPDMQTVAQDMEYVVEQ